MHHSEIQAFFSPPFLNTKIVTQGELTAAYEDFAKRWTDNTIRFAKLSQLGAIREKAPRLFTHAEFLLSRQRTVSNALMLTRLLHPAFGLRSLVAAYTGIEVKDTDDNWQMDFPINYLPPPQQALFFAVMYGDIGKTGLCRFSDWDSLNQIANYNDAMKAPASVQIEHKFDRAWIRPIEFVDHLYLSLGGIKQIEGIEELPQGWRFKLKGWPPIFDGYADYRGVLITNKLKQYGSLLAAGKITPIIALEMDSSALINRAIYEDLEI